MTDVVPPDAEVTVVAEQALEAEAAPPVVARASQVAPVDSPVEETPETLPPAPMTGETPVEPTEAAAGVAAKPPTPIPLRPSRLPAQERGDEAARDTEDPTGGEAFDEPPATQTGEEMSDSS